MNGELSLRSRQRTRPVDLKLLRQVIFSVLSFADEILVLEFTGVTSDANDQKWMDADSTNSRRQIVIQRPSGYITIIGFNDAIRASQQSRKHPHSLSIYVSVKREYNVRQ